MFVKSKMSYNSAALVGGADMYNDAALEGGFRIASGARSKTPKSFSASQLQQTGARYLKSRPSLIAEGTPLSALVAQQGFGKVAQAVGAVYMRDSILANYLRSARRMAAHPRKLTSLKKVTQQKLANLQGLKTGLGGVYDRVARIFHPQGAYERSAAEEAIVAPRVPYAPGAYLRALPRVLPARARKGAVAAAAPGARATGRKALSARQKAILAYGRACAEAKRAGRPKPPKPGF